MITCGVWLRFCLSLFCINSWIIFGNSRIYLRISFALLYSYSVYLDHTCDKIFESENIIKVAISFFKSPSKASFSFPLSASCAVCKNTIVLYILYVICNQIIIIHYFYSNSPQWLTISSLFFLFYANYCWASLRLCVIIIWQLFTIAQISNVPVQSDCRLHDGARRNRSTVTRLWRAALRCFFSIIKQRPKRRRIRRRGRYRLAKRRSRRIVAHVSRLGVAQWAADFACKTVLFTEHVVVVLLLMIFNWRGGEPVAILMENEKFHFQRT